MRKDRAVGFGQPARSRVGLEFARFVLVGVGNTLVSFVV